MALENVNIKQAKDILRNRQVSNREPPRCGRAEVSRINEGTFTVGYMERRLGYDNEGGIVNREVVVDKQNKLNSHNTMFRTYASVARGGGTDFPS